MTRTTRTLFAALIVITTFAGGGIAAYTFKYAISPMTEKGGAHSVSKVFELTKGEPTRDIAQKLATSGVISGSLGFILTARFTGKSSHFKAGEYLVSSDLTPLEIMHIFESGVSIGHPLTLREGQNIYELAAEVEERGFGSRESFLILEKTPSKYEKLIPPVKAASLEGYLFPDTYSFPKRTTQDEIIKAMLKRSMSEWGPRQENRARELGMTRHQVITLASMIEKETGATTERPLISSVFHNRLKKKMKLQSDPTTIYGMWERYTGNITHADLLTPSAYNTYTIPALPIGPIANPGREAIEAALFPAESEFLFFVSHNNGTHEFTKNFKDHQAAVKKFQLDPKAREGKSWRDLKK